ncbi:MAG: metallophosphoesterase [Parachlamydiales bacterium]|nr:metallophosphoesterase [Parachlamydiales bacterium]
MEKVSFFTPVAFSQDEGFKENILQKVDGYFALSDIRAVVVKKDDLNNRCEVIIANPSQNKNFSKMISNILKIISYMTVIIPLLMLFAKAVLRSSYEFYDLDKKENPKEKDIYFFGDIHGELDGFLQNLKHANIIDSKGNWNPKAKSTVVQMGDVIDRGPKSKEAWAYLAKLQEAAKKHSGKVIRLLGNHELMLLQGNLGYANFKNPQELANLMKKEIVQGKVKLSYCDNERLFLHAGMRSKIKDLLVEEIKRTRYGAFHYKRLFSNDSEVTIQDISDHLNHLLIEAVKSNDFSHPVFQVGKSRGGSKAVGGVLWEDVSEMMKSKHARDIPQVIAHNPPRRVDDHPVRISDSMRLINVDAGLCRVYGGKNAYAKLQGRDIVVCEKKLGIWPMRSKWFETRFQDRIRA